METPFCGWLLCGLYVFIGSLVPVAIVLKKAGQEIVGIWFVSFILILFGTLIVEGPLDTAVYLIARFIFNQRNPEPNYDPTGGLLQLALYVCIPTTIIAFLVRSIYRSRNPIGG